MRWFLSPTWRLLVRRGKKRLDIARALPKDAPVLILNEVASSHHSEAEVLSQRTLENLMGGRTTFVIAYRVSLAAKSDRIMEQGTHDAVLAMNVEYATQ